MPLIDLQRRIAEIGRIRIGHQVDTKGGKRRPEKLSTFRLTSPDQVRIHHAAELFGGTAGQWDAPAGRQWEVITNVDTLDVIVPPADMSFSQHYELWSAGGCQRRCDGRAEQITQGPCLCDAAARECDIHTRLSVMLRDLPGLGVWRIDTSGYYAAVELDGAVSVINMAAGAGQMLPARLRLEQRQVKRQVDGQPQTRQFAVPVLDVDIAPGQLISGDIAEPAAPVVEASGSGGARLTPVPAELTEMPTRTVAEQAADVDDTTPRPKRAGAAADLPATGVQPRTAAQAAANQPAHAGITDRQIKKIGALMRDVELTDKDAALAYVARTIGRDITSRKDLTKDEAGEVIDTLERDRTTQQAATSDAEGNDT